MEREKKKVLGVFIWFEDHQQEKSDLLYIEDGKVQIYRQASVNGIISNKEKKGGEQAFHCSLAKRYRTTYIERQSSGHCSYKYRSLLLSFFFWAWQHRHPINVDRDLVGAPLLISQTVPSSVNPTVSAHSVSHTRDDLERLVLQQTSRKLLL